VSFSAFIAQYYEERLHAYERLDLARCAEAELLDIAGEASALHKFLTDLLEEGPCYGQPTHRTDRCYAPAPNFRWGAQSKPCSWEDSLFFPLRRGRRGRILYRCLDVFGDIG
jgi:hypothetical protein